MSTTNGRPVASVNQRRSQRILLSIQLLVDGNRPNGTKFSEEANTLIVNAHGALILLSEPVIIGQVLTLTYVATREEISCSVVDISGGANDLPEVGVEFVELCPRFWRVHFPPPDWSPRSVEAKRIGNPGPPAPTTIAPSAKHVPSPVKK